MEEGRRLRRALLWSCIALLLVAPAAVAASAPSASTGAATNVTATSATLTGTVNPQGQATTYHFEYGAVSIYGPLYTNQTAPTSAGSGTANVSVSATIGSLTPNTTYHYRLVATNGTGTTDGPDRTFTTVKAQPPTATTGGSSSVTPTSATVTGTVNPRGQATSYHFDYGPTNAYGSQTTPASAGGGTSNVSVAEAIGSLAPSTTYHYRLVATNASGTTFGLDRTFTTSAVVPGSPVVTTGAARSVATTSATVTGTVNPKGAATRYFFQYGPTPTYGAQTGSKSAGSGTKNVSASSAIGSLKPSTLYHYRLVATNASGTGYGGDRTFTTAKATVTIVASPNVLVFGQATTIHGAVGAPGPLHTTVTLQRAARPFGPFVTIASTTSSSKGGYAFAPIAPSANTWFRAIANRGTSPTIRVIVRFRIGLSASTTRPPRGHFVRFYGRVAPPHNGLRVLLQRLGPDHRWHTVALPRLHRAAGFASAYSVRIRIRRNGLWRAIVGPDARHGRGYSRVLRIRVR